MATETTLSEKTLEDIEKAAQILSAGGLVAVPDGNRLRLGG